MAAVLPEGAAPHPPAPPGSARSAARGAREGEGRPKLVFLVTEDWYFCSHRLPVARAARDAGFAVIVVTRVGTRGGDIRAEGFGLYPLPWRRRGDGLSGHLRAIAAIARLYRTLRPDIVHHVALKPVLFGHLGRRLGFPLGGGPLAVDALMGLGSGFSATGGAAALRRLLLRQALCAALGGRSSHVVVQNPEDGAAVARLGVERRRIALIRGSGVDTRHFLPLPEPEGEPVRVALVARMLRQKGVLEAAAAVRRLRQEGLAVELVLAGPTDPDNPDSLDAAALSALAAEPGVGWLGPVADVRAVWRQAAIAVLPSSYGEGLPKTLLEAAACARPIVAADVPGCREAVRPGATGFLVPPRDEGALADAIRRLAVDPALRRRLGQAARALAERDFAEEIVAAETVALYRAVIAEGGGRP
jgi:glycosyltransferase involved in cell wall biosynthesis